MSGGSCFSALRSPPFMSETVDTQGYTCIHIYTSRDTDTAQEFTWTEYGSRTVSERRTRAKEKGEKEKEEEERERK